MKKVNVFEIKAKISEYLDLVEKGEQVVICRRNRPVAELRAVAAIRTTDRPLGGIRLEVLESFFEPLPADLEDAFHGQIATEQPSKVAGSPAGVYATAKRTKRPRRS